MSDEKWLALRDKWKKFIETPIGKAFYDFDQAHGKALVLDTRAGYEEGISDAKLKEAWAKERSAREKFMALLMGITVSDSED